MPLPPRLFQLTFMISALTGNPWISQANPVPTKATPIPLQNVRLLEGPLKQRQDLHTGYLKSLDADRFLAGFREQAGLPPKGKRYGGWEARDINGHSLGHYLSAISAAYAAAGDAELLARVNYVVDELATCQETNGDGYVLPVEKRIFDEIRRGEIRASPFNLNKVWVPLYTLHKVYAGLRDAYRYAGSQKALAVETASADWLDSVLKGLDEGQIQEVLRAEFGGMNEVLADLSVDTGNARYLEMANAYFYHKHVLDPLAAGQDRLDGQHGNTQVPKIVGLARTYELTGSERDLKAVQTFWNSVVHRRSFSFGGHGESEHFYPPAKFPQKLSPFNAEACNSYNMIKLAGHLFSWNPQAEPMDFVERTLINHIVTSLGREPGEFVYFINLDGVGTKVFSTAEDSWWCCVGTGLENPPRYGEHIYYHGGNTLWINQFIASELKLPKPGIAVRQETAFPAGDTSRLRFTLAKQQRLELAIRKPAWCEQPTFLVNGEKVEVKAAGDGYARLDRTWKTGDVLEIQLPMRLHLEPLPNSTGKFQSVMYGPLVLAAVVPPDPASPGASQGRFSDHLKARPRTGQATPTIIAETPEAFLGTLRPREGSFATFTAEGGLVPGAVLKPLYEVYREPFCVYLPYLTPAEWKEKEVQLKLERERQARLEAATLDSVLPGNQQSEVEHGLQAENSRTGDNHDEKWRDARDGGHFSYRMAVDPERPMLLYVRYWGSDRGRKFDILVDGQKIAEEALENRWPNRFEEVEYVIPPALTAGKSQVVLQVQAPAKGVAGGVFGLRTILKEAKDEVK